MARITLLSLFERSEADLRQQLAEIQLPRDEEKFNRILSDLFVEHIKVDEYKQELTPSEMAMFQSAIHLVEESLQMNLKIFEIPQPQVRVENKSEDILPQNKSLSSVLTPRISSSLLTFTGATVAGAIPYYWGTFLLAIVAAAANLVILREVDKKVCHVEINNPVSIKINADAIIATTTEICKSIDSIMAIYNTNIQNLKTRLETKEKPSLANMYGYLLNRLAMLYRDKTNGAPSDEIDGDIQRLFKTLNNYNYDFVNYSDDNKQYFEIEETAELAEPEETEVAILENGKCILKGKYYLPKK